jgi:hypothetical protein
MYEAIITAEQYITTLLGLSHVARENQPKFRKYMSPPSLDRRVSLSNTALLAALFTQIFSVA